MPTKISLRRLIWLWTLVPPIVVIITELNKKRLVWNFRVVDFVDLALMAPFYLVILLTINVTLFKDRDHGFLFWLATGMIGAFMYGHAMHLTGNAINTFATEVHDYRAGIPDDLYSLIYFLDEDLGHWIIFGSLFILLGIWGISEYYPVPFVWTDILVGILFGITYAIAIVESSQPWLGFVASIWLLFVLLKKISMQLNGFSEQWKADLFWRFILIVMITIVIVETGYALAMGGFIQPSKLGY